jgi:hypothetical protein
LVGSKTSWKANEKPRRRVWSSRPRTLAPVALMAPVATDLAARLMSGSKRTSRAKSEKAHESGNSRTNREGVPRRWSDSLQLRPWGWSDSPRGVERFAPVRGRPTTLRGNAAHELATARTNREVQARTDSWAWTNLPREVPLPRTLARLCHALWAAFRNALVLASPAWKHHRAEHRAMPCPA